MQNGQVTLTTPIVGPWLWPFVGALRGNCHSLLCPSHLIKTWFTRRLGIDAGPRSSSWIKTRFRAWGCGFQVLNTSSSGCGCGHSREALGRISTVWTLRRNNTVWTLRRNSRDWTLSNNNWTNENGKQKSMIRQRGMCKVKSQCTLWAHKFLKWLLHRTCKILTSFYDQISTRLS